MRKNRLIIGCLFVISFLIISCESDENSTEIEATSIELVTGGNQIAESETMLPEKIVVIVKDEKKYPFEGAIVSFIVTEGMVSDNSLITDSNGKAIIDWTLGSSDGEQILIVEAKKSDGVTFLNGSPLIVKAESLGLECSEEDFSDDLGCPDNVSLIVIFCMDELNNAYYSYNGINYYCEDPQALDCNEAVQEVAQALINDGCGKKSENIESLMVRIKNIKDN